MICSAGVVGKPVKTLDNEFESLDIVTIFKQGRDHTWWTGTARGWELLEIVLSSDSLTFLVADELAEPPSESDSDPIQAFAPVRIIMED